MEIGGGKRDTARFAEFSMQNESWQPKTPLLGANWREILKAQACAVVLFGAHWSAPDAIQDREIQKITADFEGQIAFFAADLDDEDGAELALQSGVSTNPTLLCFCEGQVTHKLVGFHRAPRLSEILRSWIPTN